MISVSIGLIGFIASGVLDNYIGQYRKIIIDEMVKNMSIDMQYIPESGVSKQEFKNSDIKNVRLGEYNSYDLIEFKYGAQQFRFSNIYVNTRGSSQKDNFTCVFLVTDISRELKGSTKIANRDTGKVEGFLKDMVSVDRLAMTTNYPKLEKYLKVSATHPQETEALLTPTFVQRLLRFCRKINLPLYSNFPMFFRLHLKQQKLYMIFMFGYKEGLFHVPALTEQVDYKNALRVSYTRLKIIMDLVKDLHLTNTEWASK